MPDGLDWDLWIGPAPMRPFHTYPPVRLARVAGLRRRRDGRHGVPRHGRGAFTVLKLGAPTSVDRDDRLQLPAPGARESAGSASASQYNDSYPPSSIIHLSFPARGNMPPVKLHWYDGGLLPERPEDLEPERRLPESGTIFVGDKGKMWCETYSESPRLIPRRRCRPSSARREDAAARAGGAPGHEKNWLDAIRQKGQAVSHFDYAGPFTETVLLGNVALRYPGTRLMWDAATHEGHQHAGRRSVRPAQPTARAGR